MANCGSCVITYEEGEIASFYNRREHTARKGHKCTECRRTILPGEQYEKVVAIWDGEFQVIKTCQDCRSIQDVLFCEGVMHGTLKEDLQMHIWEGESISEDCLSQLLPGARAFICDLIEEYWKDMATEHDPEFE
jgi:hypothetical protein